MDTGLLFVFAVFLFVSFFVLKKKLNLPPGRFTIPCIGTLGIIWKLRGRRPYEVFAEEAKQFGSVFSFRIVNQLFVVLNGYDNIHEALVKKADVCSGRAKTFRKMLNIESGEEGIILSDYGQSWRELRRFTIQALRDFGVGKTSIEEKIMVEVEAFTAYLRKHNGKPVTYLRPVQKVVANVIFGIVFGRRRRFAELTNIQNLTTDMYDIERELPIPLGVYYLKEVHCRYDFEDPDFDDILEMTTQILVGSGNLNPTAYIPDFIASRILTTNSEMRYKNRVSAKMCKYIDDQIDEHERTFDNDNIRDFVDFYWRSVKHGAANEKKYLTKKNMFRIIFDLFLAGSETTSVSLDWAMLYMTEFPEVQKRCQEEIERVIGGRTVTYADRTNLPYTHATVLETQRLSTLVPLSVPHMTTEDTTLGGFDIPKGTILFPNIFSATHDPKYWDEPESFRPERFLNTAHLKKRPEALIPFSEGPRECAGEPLAKMELFIVFSNLLQRFTFCREKNTVRHSLESIIGRGTNAPLPYKLRAICRSE